MNFKMNFKQLVKIKDLAYISDIGAEVGEFYPKNDQIEGKLYLTGTFHNIRKDTDDLFSETVPFLILLTNKSIVIEDIDCTTFDYTIVEGRGIEVSFEISVNYEGDNLGDEEISEDNQQILESNPNEQNAEVLDEVIDERKKDSNEEGSETSIEENNNDLKNIKEEDNSNNNAEILEENTLTTEYIEDVKSDITEEIDSKLADKFLKITDNFPSDEVTFRNIKERNSTVKVFYYANDKEIENIATKADQSLDKIFKANKNTDFNKYHRVIISDEYERKN